MIMIKVFKTNVLNTVDADNIINSLLLQYPNFRINFDWDEEETILRVEGAFFKAGDIIHFVRGFGFICIDLPIDLS